MESIRLPRFKRSSAIQSFQVTPRDHAILGHVRRHRFLRSDHIVSLLGRSAQQILRRLQLLYHHGHLERPRAQIEYYHQGGARPIVYGLGKRSAILQISQGASSTRGKEAEIPSREVRQIFLQHTLLTADLMVGLEVSARENPWLQMLHADELELPTRTRSQNHPFQWKIDDTHGQKRNVIPDALFGIRWRHPADQHKDTIYFVEADRGTMPVTRKGPGTSFLRKLIAYQQSWEQGVLRKQFGNHRFRVLTVTSTAQRREHLMEASRDLHRGKGLFLFTDQETLNAARNVLLLPWFTPDGGIEMLNEGQPSRGDHQGSARPVA